MKKTLLSTFLLCTLFALPVLAAPSPQPQITNPIRTWKTESEANKETGKFDHCLVKNMYDNGTVMILAQNNDGVERLALHFPQNKMQSGQHFDLAIQVDRRDIFPVEAIALTSQILTIGIPQALPDQMRKGNLLHLRGPNDEMIYTLRGMEGAVTSLRDCIIAQNNGSPTIVQVADATTPETVPVPVPVTAPKPALKADTPNPVITSVKVAPAPAVESASLAAPAKPAAPVAKPSISTKTVSAAPVVASNTTLAEKILQPTKKIEIAKEPLLPPQWHMIFAKTALSPDALLSIKPSKLEQPLDYMWLKDNLFIGVKEKPVSPTQSLEKLSLEYLRMLKTRCEGSFLAEASPVQANPGARSWKLAEAACSGGKKEDSVAALLFTASANTVNIVFIEAKAAKGPDAVKARDNLLNIIAK